MITPETKIQVFISSACGDEPEKIKYNFAREALKVLIESTGFAKVYTFESEGASTTSAEQHYIFALEDCDVCIFLIDNRDGVSPGTQREIDTAKKHCIKSLFYFCDQFSKEETPLQKSLKGAIYAKSKVVHDFKELIKNGTLDLINDLVLIYKHYCKGHLAWNDKHVDEADSDIGNVEFITYANNVAQKDLFTSIDICIGYFSKLILGYSLDKVQKTGKIDEACAAFLPVLFEGENINDNNFTSILLEIEKYQTPQLFAVIKERYEAIKEYYSGNQSNCLDKLNNALLLARQNGIDEWFIKDILIDLRNQRAFFEQSQNTFSLEKTYQQELDSSQSLLYYPQLDRLDSSYYKGIIEDTIKYKIQTPDTVMYGHGLEKYIRSLAEVFVLAMYNGSLTHMQLLYERIKHMAFYCATRYSDWHIKKLLLKTTIVDGNEKEIDGMLSCFDDLRSKMNSKDAYEIYAFANNRPIEYQQFIAKLEAFRVTGYYMDEEMFQSSWGDLRVSVLKWMEGDKSTVAVGSHIFSTLNGTYMRISQDELIEIICGCIHKNMRRFYDDAFNLIRDGINLDQASSESVSNLLVAISNVVKSSEDRANIYSLKPALYTLRKKFRSLTEELDKTISVEMPDFYNDTYRLETSNKEDRDMPEFLKLYITELQDDNKTQGRNGGYFSRGNQLHTTIKNILLQSTVTFSSELIISAFEESCETLLKETQTIEAKMNAIELLVYLVESRPMIRESNKQQIAKLLAKKSQIETAHAVMTNLSETNLRFSALLLYHCLGEDSAVELMNALVDIGDDALSNRKASYAFLNYLEASSTPMVDELLEHIILQRAIEWCAASNLHIRWNAIQILFLLLRDSKNKSVICNQLVKRMDTDNLYIKNTILRNAYHLKTVDPETLKYIMEKASVDTNYVVRKVVKEVRLELE
ncbi:MAG: hypothetical protein PHI98_12600 [Eubacteriales bacterium]|nr:hypothetical protein [Eubacteriales bacterium]